MHRRECLSIALGAGVMAFAELCAAEPASEPLRDLLKLAIGTGEKVAGRIAVVIDQRGTHIGAIGSSDAPGVAMGTETVFEIGSITKVLTALVLADMVARGEVAFGDPVARYLPASVVLHERGRPITLLDLATYHSGLPNMPGNMPPRWWAVPNPYAHYTTEELYAFLSSYVPMYEPGSRYQYANLGFALLGIALARRAGRSYESLLIDRVCDPLGLGDTRVTLTRHMRRHLAQGHSPDSLQRTVRWEMPGLPEMGGVLSTARDLTVLLKASMGRERTPLSASFARLTAVRRPTTVGGTDVGLGWFISSSKAEEIVWKSGLTGGFSSFIGFSNRSGRGAVALSNGGYVAGLGFRLINPEFDPGDLDPILR